MHALSGPIRRVLALALLGALLIVVASSVVFPLLAKRAELTERVEQKRQLVARLSSASSAPDTDVGALKSRLDTVAKRNFMSGESRVIRAANVQAAVVQTLSADNLKSRSIRNLPPRSRAGVSLIGVQVQVGVTLPQLQSLLTRIDMHSPRLLVEDIQITAAPASAVSGEALQRMLDVRMDVFGLETPGAVGGEAKK